MLLFFFSLLVSAGQGMYKRYRDDCWMPSVVHGPLSPAISHGNKSITNGSSISPLVAIRIIRLHVSLLHILPAGTIQGGGYSKKYGNSIDQNWSHGRPGNKARKGLITRLDNGIWTQKLISLSSKKAHTHDHTPRSTKEVSLQSAHHTRSLPGAIAPQGLLQ